jgi:DtxR family Mn-dependent transcriptional regulator
VHPEFQAQPKDEILELIWRRREDGDRSLSSLLEEAHRQSLHDGGSAASGSTRPDGAGLEFGANGDGIRPFPGDVIRDGGGPGGDCGVPSVGGIPSASDDDTPRVLQVLEREGLVRISGGEVHLTESGESRARTVIRGHRLAKRLLFDVFALPPEEIERTACLMEHILGPATADAVCAFLGHPPRSPAGREIPPGECCKAAQERRVQPLVIPLHELPRGGMGRIAFMTPSYQKRFDRLGTFGVVPGNRIRLRQTQPSVVIEIDGTSLALDRDVAREIYVRRET